MDVHWTIALTALMLASCMGQTKKEPTQNSVKIHQRNTLPAPFATKSVTKRSTIIDWPAGAAPKAPAGFVVTRFAEGLEDPRNCYIAPNGDVFVAESAAGRVALLRDKDHDGNYETQSKFLTGLRQPYGMLVIGKYFFVANTDGVYRYDYDAAALKSRGIGTKILSLPAGGYNNHWTRNLIASRDQSKIYVTVGSGSNAAEHGLEHERRRANILEINPDGTDEKIYASGLRNPVGMDWNPANGELWTAVNERDGLGDELVPDYVTHVVRGGFYGWPFFYFGKHEDPQLKGQGSKLAASVIEPDVAVGSHTASLGLAFYDKAAFPQKYRNGMFVGQHGSWNRSTFSGYKVVFIPFVNGKAGEPEDFLTGFIADEKHSRVYGRPVDVTVTEDGALLVNDDGSDIIWKIAYAK